MKFNKVLVSAVLAGFLLSGCYAYGGGHHGGYYGKPSIEFDYRYSHRSGIDYNYRYRSYTPRYYRHRHGEHRSYQRHGYYGRPYGAAEYRNPRYGSYRRECWDHRYKRHYYC